MGGPEITDEGLLRLPGRRGKELALVDAGLGFHAGDYGEHRNLGLDPSLLKYVVATHGHIDHIGGLSYFQSKEQKLYRMNWKAVLYRGQA